MRGVLIASDQTQEWMLPWWWERYQAYNSFPVAFVDMGLSLEKKRWCQERGQWIVLRLADYAEEADPEEAKKWQADFGAHIWSCRNAWFKKPFACLKTPFTHTLWLDLDCEVRGSLLPLFHWCETEPGFALSKDYFASSPEEIVYNTGVIAFRKEHPLLQEWADWCLSQFRFFCGDQEALSALIRQRKKEVELLPKIYNWSRFFPDEPGVVIHHWHGNHGKTCIRHSLL